jgi:hypothetical protein
MPDRSPFHESQKLVRCEVVNRYQESSVRFIEIGSFKLWEYLMTSKHSLKVGDPRLCLWVDDSEYQANANVFDRAGDIEEVDRIVVELFDREYGFSQTSTRYARRSETEQVLDILRSHIPPELRDSDACTIDVIHGHVVQQWQTKASRNILMGLEG